MWRTSRYSENFVKNLFGAKTCPNFPLISNRPIHKTHPLPLSFFLTRSGIFNGLDFCTPRLGPKLLPAQLSRSDTKKTPAVSSPFRFSAVHVGPSSEADKGVTGKESGHDKPRVSFPRVTEETLSSGLVQYFVNNEQKAQSKFFNQDRVSWRD